MERSIGRDRKLEGVGPEPLGIPRGAIVNFVIEGLYRVVDLRCPIDRIQRRQSRL